MAKAQMCSCQSRFETRPPMPVVLLTCDLDEGHSADHHGIRRDGPEHHIEIEMEWTNEQALNVG